MTVGDYRVKLRPAGFTGSDLAKEMAALAVELRKRIEAEVTGLDESKAAIEARRKRALADDGFEYFCRTYFPHYVKSASASRLHKHLFKRLPEVVSTPKGGAREGVIAPRGEAKSTFCSQLFPIWNVARKGYKGPGRKARRDKNYIIIVMDVFAQACGMVEAIKAELESNPRLKLDFPEMCGAGPVWREGEMITVNGVKIEGVGAGQKLRGRRHGPHRPDLVILDDIENDEAVRSPDQRDKLDKWVDKAVLNLGAADGSMDVIYVGTVLHYDSVLVRKARNVLWRFMRLKSILRWPDRMDLWQRWEEIIRSADGTDEDDKARALEEAEDFYQAHQVAMEAGAEVSWPEVRPLKMLMTLRIQIGEAAFNSEQQNDPMDEDGAPFRKLTFWVNRLPEWTFIGALDPSLGKQNKARDPSAILVGGVNRETGILDVVEASIARRLPDLIIEEVIRFQTEYRCTLWSVETIQFQAFLHSELIKRSVERGTPVPAQAVTPNTDKSLRIMGLQPYVAAGVIRVHASQTVLLQQLQNWPMADHDDGPDCLEMLWQLAQQVQSGSAPLLGGTRLLISHQIGFASPDIGTPDDPGLDGTAESWHRQLGGFLH
ncbi:phage terminase large subunit [Niveispirillum sp. KHB5.9]|uniref:phage terminase large subunit n=1 Tax=Niveispirillum sp. KHB5.9 TaxID=3400269 RepID=UPI003A87DAB9